MARDVGDGAGRMVDRVATAKTADDRFYMLQCEQRVVGDLGCIRRGLCPHHPADLPFPFEPTRV